MWLTPIRALALSGFGSLLAVALAWDAPSEVRQEPLGPVLAGEVLIGDQPADSGTVVLHRVSAFFTGEVDSVAVDRRGAFEIRLPAEPDSQAGDVFFASIRYQNVLYFGEAITGAENFAEPYLIQTYPTVGAGAGTFLPLRVRNVFVQLSESGRGWNVTDLFEIGNDARATLVASEDGATWTHALPPEAVDFSVGQSDLSPDAASFREGRIHVSAPIPPGGSVYLLRYRVPEDDFTIPLEGGAGSMELLVREPAGELTVSGLAAAEGIELEGFAYRRFAGREMAPSVVTVARGTPLTPTGSIPLLAVLITLSLAAAGAFLVARGRARPLRAHRATDRRRGILVQIARLDEEWSGGSLEVEDYDRRRERLIEELRG
ncbi:MAG: hypothetical protein OXE96_14225 [Gemmatimonadetes bacterium]|nr:hypothetical protein [Gemmatimonadota bacterium]